MTNKIMVVTDSNATVPKELVKALDISVVPVQLTLGDRTYRDGVDITPNEFYRLLLSSEHVPTTSGPTLGDFVHTFEVAAQKATGIVSIHLPPNLSNTLETAVLASKMVEHVPIRVVNSKSPTMAQGFVVIEAARAAAIGVELDEVVARAEEVASKVRFFAMLDTLEYLHRGGRIGGAAALMGSILRIKPVVYLVDGRVEPLARPLTRSRGIQHMLQAMAKEVKGRPVHAAILQADALEAAKSFREIISEQFNCLELYIAEFTPAMGAHAGPGVLGVAYYVD